MHNKEKITITSIGIFILLFATIFALSPNKSHENTEIQNMEMFEGNLGKILKVGARANFNEGVLVGTDTKKIMNVDISVEYLGNGNFETDARCCIDTICRSATYS